MLERVVAVGKKAADAHNNVTLAVATEDQRIADYCAEIGTLCFMTSEDCATGSDRVHEAAQLAAKEQGQDFDFVFSLQGDAPFTPPDAVAKMLACAHENKDAEVITPVVRLRWPELDALRESKKTVPFSGTTAIIDESGKALWFSKNIIPAIRTEDALRGESEFSPVHQHIGLYGYRYDILKRYIALPQGHYEQLEGLEQLRMLENGISIQTVLLDVDLGCVQAGIDSPEDIDRAEKMIQEYGDG